MAASAWNDNGMAGRVQEPAAIYRSDFFPGLGWMLTRRIWNELGPKWPEAFWDDWLREPEQRQGRHFLRPEICRTYHFGNVGASGGQFAELWESVYLNDRPVDFSIVDLSYIRSEEIYDEWLGQELNRARLLTIDTLQRVVESGKSDALLYGTVWKIQYRSLSHDFTQITRILGLYTDLKAGIPRTAYKGIVTVRVLRARVHIVPLAAS